MCTAWSLQLDSLKLLVELGNFEKDAFLLSRDRTEESGLQQSIWVRLVMNVSRKVKHACRYETCTHV